MQLGFALAEELEGGIERRAFVPVAPPLDAQSRGIVQQLFDTPRAAALFRNLGGRAGHDVIGDCGGGGDAANGRLQRGVALAVGGVGGGPVEGGSGVSGMALRW